MNGIKISKNPYHQLLDKCSLGFVILVSLSILFFTTFRVAIIGIIGFNFILFLLHLILSKARKYEIKILIDELRDTIENIELNNNPELIKKQKIKIEKVNEWTFSKIIIRIIAYPFCLIVIWLSFTGLLLEGKFFQGFFGIIIGLAYPISDILLILKKDKL